MLKAHLLGDFKALHSGHDDFFCKRAVHGAEKDFIPDLQAVDALAQLCHHAGAFRAWGERKGGLQLVFAFDDQDVRKVDACGADLDADMALLDFRGVDVLHFVGLVGAKGLANDSFHGGVS